MGLCRVDSDRLRGLASQLGVRKAALDEATPAATIMASFGYAADAAAVVGRFGDVAEWVDAWSLSLDERADLVDRHMAFYASSYVAGATSIDAAAGGALAAMHSGGSAPLTVAVADVASAVADLRALVDVKAEPSAVASFFATLDPALMLRVAAQEAATVGRLGGAPLEARFLANQIVVSQTRDDVARIAMTTSGGERFAALRELMVLEGLADGGRRFLAFDWEAARIVEWLGPLEASNVAAFLPGATVGLLDYPDLAERVGAMITHDPSQGDLAVLLSLTYDTPPSILHAAYGGYADDGGPELVELLRGVDLSGRHVSLVGHSYGSVVIGEALKLGVLDVLSHDVDVVVLGSPGVRADHVSALAVAAESFWAGLLPGDLIDEALHPSEILRLALCSTRGLVTLIERCEPGNDLIHGANPADESFGGNVISLDGVVPKYGSHSDYLATRTTIDGAIVPSLMLRKILAIVVGAV